MTPNSTPFPLDHLTLRGDPDAPALVADGRTLSFADLEEAVGKTAAALLGHDLTPGDRVASWMGKTALAWFGQWDVMTSLSSRGCRRCGISLPIRRGKARGRACAR